MGLLDKLEQVEIKADSRLPEEGYTHCWSFDAERARANRMEGWEEYYQEDMK